MSTNVAVDEELLEQARRVTGERTYSGTVNRALAELVRREKLKKSFEKMYADGDPFRPGYLEEIRPNSQAVIEESPKRRVTSNARRAPREKARSRGSR
ncbi:MAG: type II toxin-antitoxin system VapB family antitoxin [Acidobacteria bacterium]|nr:type II toxin-antitoxin system VapB family antitoxin [Acidobacteriota bacterium]